MYKTEVEKREKHGYETERAHQTSPLGKTSAPHSCLPSSLPRLCPLAPKD